MIKLENVSNRGDVERRLNSTVKNTVVKKYRPPKNGEDSEHDVGGGGLGGATQVE